jgi:hypothetical protein
MRRHAGVVELADTLDLGSSAARRGGSSPLTRTSFSSFSRNASLLTDLSPFTIFVRRPIARFLFVFDSVIVEAAAKNFVFGES